MKKSKKKKLDYKNDLGFANFHCKHCEKEFEVSWLDIFSLQEATHGYAGFELNEDYIACPKCWRNANSVEGTKRNFDYNLPF